MNLDDVRAFRQTGFGPGSTGQRPPGPGAPPPFPPHPELHAGSMRTTDRSAEMLRPASDPPLAPLGVIALNRMGFGPRPGDLDAFAALGSDGAMSQAAPGAHRLVVTASAVAH